MSDVPTPHVHLFRATFGQPEHTKGLLEGVLPPALVAAIDWSTLRREEGTFVDDELRGRQCDLLRRAELGGRPLLS